MSVVKVILTQILIILSMDNIESKLVFSSSITVIAWLNTNIWSGYDDLSGTDTASNLQSNHLYNPECDLNVTPVFICTSRQRSPSPDQPISVSSPSKTASILHTL